MAKGQKRSNREIKKPKATKASASALKQWSPQGIPSATSALFKKQK